MSPIRTLEDLVRAGALGTAEYVLSHPQRDLSVRDMLIRRYGDRMQAGQQSINALIRRAESASQLAGQFALTGRITRSEIPGTPGIPGRGQYLYNALVTVYSTDANGNRNETDATIFINIRSDDILDYKTVFRRARQKISAYCLAAGRERSYERFCSVRAGTDDPQYELLMTGIYRQA